MLKTINRFIILLILFMSLFVCKQYSYSSLSRPTDPLFLKPTPTPSIQIESEPEQSPTPTPGPTCIPNHGFGCNSNNDCCTGLTCIASYCFNPTPTPTPPIVPCRGTLDCPVPPFSCGGCIGSDPSNPDSSICVNCEQFLSNSEKQECYNQALGQVQVEILSLSQNAIQRQLNEQKINQLKEREATLKDCGKTYYARIDRR